MDQHVEYHFKKTTVVLVLLVALLCILKFYIPMHHAHQTVAKPLPEKRAQQVTSRPLKTVSRKQLTAHTAPEVKVDKEEEDAEVRARTYFISIIRELDQDESDVPEERDAAVAIHDELIELDSTPTTDPSYKEKFQAMEEDLGLLRYAVSISGKADKI